MPEGGVSPFALFPELPGEDRGVPGGFERVGRAVEGDVIPGWFDAEPFHDGEFFRARVFPPLLLEGEEFGDGWHVDSVPGGSDIANVAGSN